MQNTLWETLAPPRLFGSTWLRLEVTPGPVSTHPGPGQQQFGGGEGSPLSSPCPPEGGGNCLTDQTTVRTTNIQLDGLADGRTYALNSGYTEHLFKAFLTSQPFQEIRNPYHTYTGPLLNPCYLEMSHTRCWVSGFLCGLSELKVSWVLKNVEGFVQFPRQLRFTYRLA